MGMDYHEIDLQILCLLALPAWGQQKITTKMDHIHKMHSSHSTSLTLKCHNLMLMEGKPILNRLVLFLGLALQCIAVKGWFSYSGIHHKQKNDEVPFQ